MINPKAIPKIKKRILTIKSTNEIKQNNENT